MPASVIAPSSVDSGVWLNRERVLGRFEDAWRSGRPPDLGTFLPPGRLDPELLLELVHTDLEYRVSRGLGGRVEAYLRDFPELSSDRRAVADLAAAEFRARTRAGQAVTPDEMFARFPHPSDEISSRLSAEEPAGAAPGERTAPLVPGTEEPIARVGKYDLDAEIGAGAFGRVYRGRDPELDRPVAVKIARPGRFASDGAADRFVREARAAAQLRHPNLLAVFDAGRTPEGGWFIASAFLPGGTLYAQLKSRGVIPPAVAAGWAAEAADGLQFAHENGIIHRDVKPANLMLDDRGRVQVVDFGLARRPGTDPTLTLDGQVLGTPAYMSPEQAEGRAGAADARADVYGLGATLYHLVTGRPPFAGKPAAVIHAVIHTDPDPPRRVSPAVPRDLDRIIQKAMAKEPHARYRTAGGLADDLRRFLRGEPVTARPLGPGRRLVRWARRSPVVAGLTAGLFAVTAAGGGLFAWKYFEAAANFARAEERNRAAVATFVAGERQADDGRRLLADLLKAGVLEGLEPVTLQHLSAAFLEDVAGHFEKTLADRPLGRDRAGTARLYAALGLVRRMQGRPEAAAAALIDGLAHRDPGSPDEADDRLALATARLAERKLPEARAAFAELRAWAAAESLRTPATRALAVRAAVGESQCLLIPAGRRGHPDAVRILDAVEPDAGELAADPAATPAHRFAVAEYRQARGLATLRTDGPAARAAADARQAAAGLARLLGEYPASADLTYRLALAHQLLADAEGRAGGDPRAAREKAAESFHAFVVGWEARLARAPADPAAKSALAVGYNNLASAHAAAGRADDAVRCNRRAAELFLELHRTSAAPRSLHGARDTLRNLTRVLIEAKRFEEAEATLGTRAELAGTSLGELYQVWLDATGLRAAIAGTGRPIPPGLADLTDGLGRRTGADRGAVPE